MKLKELTIKGAIPFPEEANITFPDTKKIAITGDNGAGKSTLLDCIYAAIYGDTTKPGGIYPLFSNAKDGLIELSFQLGKKDILIKRMIDGVGRKQKPWLYVDGVTMTEGKVAEFSEQIQKLLCVSESSFLASVYSAQTGKGNPLSLSDGDKRNLLAEVLGLHRFSEPHRIVTEELKKAQTCYDMALNKKSILATGISDIASINQTLQGIKFQKSELEKAIQYRENELEKARQELADAKANAQNLDEVNRNIKTLEGNISQQSFKKMELQARIDKNKNQLLDKADEIRTAANLSISINSEITALEEGLPALKEALKQKQDEFIEEQGKVKLRLNTLSSAINELENKKLVKASQLNKTEKVLLELNNFIQTKKPETLLLADVPCAGTDMNDSCKLLESARVAVTQVKEKESRVPDVEVDILTLKAEILEIDKSITPLKTEYDSQNMVYTTVVMPGAETQRKIEQVEANVFGRKSQLEKLKNLSENLPHLELAEERIAQYEADILSINRSIESGRKALDLWKLKKQQASSLQAVITRNEETVRVTASAIADSRAALEENLLKSERLKTQKEGSEKASGELQVLEDELSSISLKLEELTLLKEGLSPKGAPALIVDSAAPDISQIVNALLQECYGSQFTIQIKTQYETQAGDVRERLDFEIIDNTTGEISSIDQKSGGEQQIIKEVISIGLCVYQKLKSGIELKTLIRDEACSALTEDNTERYVRMLDKSLSIGGFDQVLFVSHKGCAQAMADASLHISNGKVKLER